MDTCFHSGTNMINCADECWPNSHPRLSSGGTTAVRTSWRGLMSFSFGFLITMTQQELDKGGGFHFRVLRFLLDSLKMSQRNIECALGGSASGVKCCVSDLIEIGIFKVRNLKESNHKFSFSYILSARIFSERSRLLRYFFERKLWAYNDLKAEISLNMQDDETLKGSPHGDRRK